MSTLGAVSFAQDRQDHAVNAMDTSPISQVDAVFLPPLPESFPIQLLQPSLYIDKSDHTDAAVASMHISLPDLASSSFIAPLETLDVAAPSLHTASFPSNFVPQSIPFTLIHNSENSMPLELSPSDHTLSSSPPQSHIGLSGGHNSNSAFTMGMSSSLESALDPTGISTNHNRINTSVSPSTNPQAFPQIPMMVHSLSPAYTEPIPTVPLTVLGPQLSLVPLLKQIAQTAESAGYAICNHDDESASSKVDELKVSISKVAEMLEKLSVSKSEQSRKRCAAELDAERTVKSLKREPQEDIVLSLPQIDPAVPIPAEQSPTYPTPLSAHPQSSITRPMAPLPHSTSHPPSRTSSPARGAVPPRASFTPPQSSACTNFSAFIPSSSAVEFPPKVTSSIASPVFGVGAPSALPWTESVVPVSRHHHSLSTGAITSPMQTMGIAPVNTTTARHPDTYTHKAPVMPSSMMAASPSAISPPIGRMSRSGSVTGITYSGSFSFSYPPKEPSGWPTTSQQTQNFPPTPYTSRSQSQSNWYFGPSEHSGPSASPSTNSEVSSTMAGTAPTTSRSTPSDPEENDDDHDSDASDSRSKSTFSKKVSNDNHGLGPSSSIGSDVPVEYRSEVDRVFFEYLNKICSNLDATDSKGEPIHQTLMAKKMQRLDESPDFRPFKFRIQAFTMAFLEELASQGYPEEKIPMKKIRNYLWHQPYILRFNEDGKKAKSKGNHIWNIEARKAGDGKWEFRPFQRKLAGSPPSVAYCGLRWSWTPRIWDPQASWQNVPVTYSSPSLPYWLSWKEDILSGIPPSDAENCTITANAKFVIDGQEGHLSHTFTITIAPVSSIDATSFSRSRRPSLVNEPPKRSTSDSALFQAPQRARARVIPAPIESADTRVIRVLQTAAQRVTQEAESQLVSVSPKNNLHALVKQKHVLDQTVDAYDRALSGHCQDEASALAVAAQNVVVQAAQKVYADRGGGVPPPQGEAAIQSVTVGELTEVTQDAIAKAVQRNGTASTEVDIVRTAAGIIKLESDAAQAIPLQIRSVTAGTLQTRMNPPLTNSFPTNLSPLPEYS